MDFICSQRASCYLMPRYAHIYLILQLENHDWIKSKICVQQFRISAGRHTMVTVNLPPNRAETEICWPTHAAFNSNGDHPTQIRSNFRYVHFDLRWFNQLKTSVHLPCPSQIDEQMWANFRKRSKQTECARVAATDNAIIYWCTRTAYTRCMRTVTKTIAPTVVRRKNSKFTFSQHTRTHHTKLATCRTLGDVFCVRHKSVSERSLPTIYYCVGQIEYKVTSCHIIRLFINHYSLIQTKTTTPKSTKPK